MFEDTVCDFCPIESEKNLATKLSIYTLTYDKINQIENRIRDLYSYTPITHLYYDAKIRKYCFEFCIMSSI